MVAKTYNFVKLLLCNGIDAQKYALRLGSKEAYFTHLTKFTEESREIMDQYDVKELAKGNFDIDQITEDLNKLQRMLGGIGAVGLTWNIEKLFSYLGTMDVRSYSQTLTNVYSDISNLRAKIMQAEKPSDSSEQKQIASTHDPNPEEWNRSGEKAHGLVRNDVFESLLLLIDNFEFDGATDTLKSIMKYTYSPEIDQMLYRLHTSLVRFDSDRALEEAKELLGIVKSMESNGNKRNKYVLIIDDMPDVIRTVKAMLRDKYAVYGMTNFNSAIKFLNSNVADLILLDIEMPDINGFTILQLFRKLPEYAKTPILFLTSNASPENIKKAIRLGANDFIKKPVESEILVDKLEKAFSNA